MKRGIILIAALFFSYINYAAVSVKYTLSFEEPQTHYVKVRMDISGLPKDCKLKMPVWTPGSYLVREFSRFVEQFYAKDESGKLLDSKKVAKNAWEIKNKSNNLIVEYYVYAYELTVRTSFIDEEHAYFNGASLFMYVDGYIKTPAVVEIKPYQKWKTVSVALDRVEQGNPWIVKAADYDALIDAPFAIGNHTIFSFSAAGVHHDVAMVGAGTYDSLKIKEDFTKIVEKEFSIFGQHPCKNYLFIVHILPTGGGGGLEHMNSTTIQTNRVALTTVSGYTGFLSTVAHEYFHLWNAKRLRPFVLGPFDYDNENYTGMLFFSEGFTAFYDDHLLSRCRLLDEDAYLKTLASNITTIENSPGNKIQSLYESGFDAWIKYYRSNENSSNATVSYYTKGAVIGAMLDIQILNATDGKAGLDEVMKYMYDEYYQKQRRGFKDDELVAAVNKICNCDMNDFFYKYIYQTQAVPYDEILSQAGIKVNVIKETGAYLGLTTTVTPNKVTVTTVERNSAAWKYGLNVNDEIVAIDGNRITEDPAKYVASKKPGDKLTFIVVRSGLMKTIEVVLTASPKVSYQLEKMESANQKQQKIYQNWMDL